MSPIDLSIERAARAIWRALHDPREIRPWDAAERERYIRAAQMATQVLQYDQIVVLQHRGRVS